MKDQFAQTVRLRIPPDYPKEISDRKKPRPVIKKQAQEAPPWEISQESQVDESYFYELLQSLYDGVVITELNGRIVDANDRAMEFLLYNKKELSRLTIVDIIAGATTDLLKTLCSNIEKGRFTLIEAFCVRKDGTLLAAEIAANRLVLTQQGHLCFFMRNITKRKEREDALLQTVSKLKELDNAKSRFVSNVSHELRTPLTIISAFVSLVNDGVIGAVNDKQKECMDTVLRNCGRLSGLIENILDLGRVESGREEFKRKEVDMASLLKQCHHDFLPKFIAKQQQFTLEISDELSPVLCDNDKVAQVLTNLVGNANKFTPAGGAVALRAHPVKDGVKITVEDNGPGIKKEDQTRIFEAFTQMGRAELGAESKGTGLGLTISKYIIDAHNGTITVDSVPGQGCQFSFTLPTYEEQAACAAFISDKVKFVEARGSQLSMAVLKVGQTKPSSGEPVKGEEKRQLLQTVKSCAMEAFACAKDRVFVSELRDLVILLLDTGKSGLGQKIMSRRLAQIVGSTLKEKDISIELAWSKFDNERSANEWLEETVGHLKQVTIKREASLSKRVLIVDDDETILKLMIQVLSDPRFSFNIHSTSSGYDACIHFGEFKPDLVILDLHLPDIDGKRVFKSMNRKDIHRRTRILVISGYPRDIDEMMALGCDDFLCKPFETNALIDKVLNLLEMPV